MNPSPVQWNDPNIQQPPGPVAAHAPTLSLYQILDEMDAWANSLDLAQTDEDRAEIEAQIRAYLVASADKVDRFNTFLAHCESQVELAKTEEDRLANRRRSIERTVDTLKEYAVRTMEHFNKRKLEGNTSSLVLRKIRDVAEITDETKVPDQYRIATIRIPHAEAKTVCEFFPNAEYISTTIPKDRLLKDLQAGENVEGARLRTNDERGHGHNCLIRK